jgi:PTH1 family peptidyl-tRNA hydrolase
MKLIVGLGNPGRRYQYTRHNLGFMFVDEIARAFNLKFSKDRNLKSLITSFHLADERIIIIKPQTYMNLSGNAVRIVADYYRIDYEDIIVVYDDLDLPEGKIRIRKSGTSGGHKGMANIIEMLRTDSIKRIRIGIGNHQGEETVDYVLSEPTKEGKAQLLEVIKKAPEMLEFCLKNDFDDFMKKYN